MKIGGSRSEPLEEEMDLDLEWNGRNAECGSCVKGSAPEGNLCQQHGKRAKTSVPSALVSDHRRQLSGTSVEEHCEPIDRQTIRYGYWS